MKYGINQFFTDTTNRLTYEEEQEQLQQRLNKRKKLEEKSRQWFINEFNKTLELNNGKVIFAKDITEYEIDEEIAFGFQNYDTN